MKIVHLFQNTAKANKKATKSNSALNWMIRQEAKDRQKARQMFLAERQELGMEAGNTYSKVVNI